MDADERRERLNDVSRRIIGCAFTVANALGCGFLEKVYENALAHELRKAGLKTDQQQGITVRYDGAVVGEYVADLLVEDAVVVELKAAKALDDVHLAQCLNYTSRQPVFPSACCSTSAAPNSRSNGSSTPSEPALSSSVFICVHLRFPRSRFVTLAA